MTDWLAEAIQVGREIIEEIRLSDPAVDAVVIKDYVSVDESGLPTTGETNDDNIGGTLMDYVIRSVATVPVRFEYVLQKRASSTAEVPTGEMITGEQDFDIVLPAATLIEKSCVICIVDVDNNILRSFEVIEPYTTSSRLTLRIAVREKGK